MSNTTYTTLGAKDLRKSLALLLRANQTAMIWSSPGLGKTAIVNQLAKDNDLEPILFSLVANEPGDFNGLPSVRKGEILENDRAEYVPFDIFPLVDTPIPEGKNGWLLFVDELPAGGPEMQAASLKLIHERLVGNRKLHPNVYIIAAGNYTTDRAYSNKLISSLSSRVTHLHTISHSKDWLEYATAQGFDWRVLAYIEEHPDKLHVFDPSSDPDLTFRCYRTWENLSDILKQVPEITNTVRPVIEGTIGIAGSAHFVSFARLANRLPRRSEIKADPASIEIPTNDKALQYMLAYLMMDITQTDHFSRYIPMFKKFSGEMQFLIFKGWSARPGVASVPEIQTHPDLDEWVQHAIKIISA